MYTNVIIIQAAINFCFATDGILSPSWKFVDSIAKYVVVYLHKPNLCLQAGRIVLNLLPKSMQ